MIKFKQMHDVFVKLRQELARLEKVKITVLSRGENFMKNSVHSALANLNKLKSTHIKQFYADKETYLVIFRMGNNIAHGKIVFFGC
jgi:hypothetical protein